MRRQDHYPVLDGVRFACALAVLAYHFLTVFPLAASSVTRDFDPVLALPGGWAHYSWWGWVGVDLFFVVSGYVIAISAARAGPGRFVRRRALRLLPAAWICATLTAVILLFGSAVPVEAVATRWLTSMLLFPLGQPIDEIYWTLGVEVAFYAVVAALLRDGGDNRARLRGLALVLALASLSFWLGRYYGWLTLDPQARPVRLLLLPHGGFFAVGIALHALAERRSLALWWTLAVGFVAGGCEIVALAGTMHGVPGFYADPLVPLGVFAGGVAVIAAAPRVRGQGIALLPLLGAMTYPLYLLNQRFAAGLLVALHRLGVPVGWAMAGAALAVLMLAWGIAAWAEPGARAWLSARLRPSRGPASDTLPSASLPAG